MACAAVVVGTVFLVLFFLMFMLLMIWMFYPNAYSNTMNVNDPRDRGLDSADIHILRQM